MKKKLDILKWLLPLVVLLATACGHDDLVLPDEYQEEPPTPYVEVRIAVPLANPYGTRANPMGGEEGNGREHGIEKEDIIHDINVYFFIEKRDEYGNGLGMDSPDAEIIMQIYYNLDNPSDPLNTEKTTANADSDNNPYYYLDKRYVILKFECSEEYIKQVEDNRGINFVAIANLGPVQSISTLNALRNIDLTRYGTKVWQHWGDAFSQNAKDMDYFMMSTAYNDTEDNKYGTNKITASKSANGTSYSGTTTLQRMYARLDLWYNGSQIRNIEDDGKTLMELDYQIKDKDKDETPLEHHVYITNVLPVNVMQKPSYVFKKVTNGVSDFSLIGLKSASDYLWGGKESPKEGIYTSSTNDRPTNYVIEPTTTRKLGGGGTNLNTLNSWYGSTKTADVKTNIQDVTKGYLLQYYHDTPASENTPNSGEHISIISYANENTHPTDCFHSNYLTGMAFRAVYVPENIYKDFSETTTKDEKGKDKVIYELISIAGNESIGSDSIYRYSPTAEVLEEGKSLYFTTRVKAEDYAKKNSGDIAVITSYKAEKHTLADGSQKWGFICYYNLWLRHYNDVNDTNKSDPHEHLPMEYATVRNNIYRVSVSFSGPGDPEPTMREPDTMKARIFVRKWNYREEDKIIF